LLNFEFFGLARFIFVGYFGSSGKLIPVHRETQLTVSKKQKNLKMKGLQKQSKIIMYKKNLDPWIAIPNPRLVTCFRSKI